MNIIEQARAQGLPETETEGVFRVNADDLGRMLAAERERCAKVCEGVEARATLASEREANARLTAELEEAQRHAAATDAALSDLRGELWEERRQHDITRGVLEMVRSGRDMAFAEIAQWEKLRDPDTLHANLLRGQPARLTHDHLRHLLGKG